MMMVGIKAKTSSSYIRRVVLVHNDRLAGVVALDALLTVPSADDELRLLLPQHCQQDHHHQHHQVVPNFCQVRQLHHHFLY
jgi:hypothetical protein